MDEVRLSLILLAVALIGWNIYRGVTVKKIGIPGIFEIEFGSYPTPTPGPTPDRGLSTDNWAGDWICTTNDHQMTLTINGKGRDSSLQGYYPVAYGNQPATEEYIIRSITDTNVSGDYIYYDSNPNIGYQGRAGVWKGEWSITFREDSMGLTRKDHTTSWRGEYHCTRK